MSKIKFVLAKYDSSKYEYLAIIPTNQVNPGKCMSYTVLYNHSEISLQFIKESCKAIRKPSVHGNKLKLLLEYLVLEGYTRNEIPTKFLEVLK